MPPQPTSWRSILIWPSYLPLGLPMVSFPQFSPPKLCMHLSCPHKCHILCPSHSSRFDDPNNIWWGVHIIKLLSTYSSLLACYLVPLRPEYLPQHPVLEHHQPISLPQCERSSFSPIPSTGKRIVLRIWIFINVLYIYIPYASKSLYIHLNPLSPQKSNGRRFRRKKARGKA